MQTPASCYTSCR